MNPHSERRSETPLQSANLEENVPVESVTLDSNGPTAADYFYRIAALIAGIFLLATVV